MLRLQILQLNSTASRFSASFCCHLLLQRYKFFFFFLSNCIAFIQFENMVTFFIFFLVLLCFLISTCLVTLGLGCSMWGLRSWLQHEGSPIVISLFEIFYLQHEGFSSLTKPRPSALRGRTVATGLPGKS